MPPAESDIDLLETDLDGALDAAAAAKLAHRLAMEPELASLRAELVTQREQRKILFRALEPTDAAIEQFAWRIRGAVAEHRAADAYHAGRAVWSKSWQLARWGGAVAATLVLGFSLGRAGRPLVSGPSPQTPIAYQTPAPNEPPGLRTVGSNVMVPVADEYGHVVAWQPFHNTDDARRFAEDLNRTRLPVQSSSSDNVKLAADESEQKF